MKKFLIDFIKTHPFLFAVIIISCVLALIPTGYALIMLIPKYFLYSWVFWIPVLIITFVQLCTYFLYKKFPLFTKIVTFLLNIIILFLLLVFLIFAYALLKWKQDDYIAEKPQYYQVALKSFSKDNIRHFPREIPLNANNPIMFFPVWSSLGCLKFNIDEQYIRNELSKYSFEKIVNKDEIIFDCLKYRKIKAEKFTYYVIKEEILGEKKEDKRSQGIAVSSDFTEIIYYYYHYY